MPIRWRTTRDLPIALIILAPLAAHANLNLVPGLMPAQASAAAGTQLVYNTLSSRGSLTPGEQSLFELTRELVETSNEQQGSGPTQFSLGLTVEGLQKALQWVAAEELTTPGTMASKTSSGQLASLAARFTAIRHGVTGFQVSLLNDEPFDFKHAPLMLAMGPGGDMSGLASGSDDSRGFSKLSGFLNGSLGFGSKDPTSREDAFDYGNNNLTLGADYRLNDNLVYGAALGYTSYKAEFDSSKSVVDGSVKSGAYTGTLYGLYYLDSFSVDGAASLGASSFDIVRHIMYPSNNLALPPTNEVAYGSPDGNQYTLSVGGNYEGNRQSTGYSLQAHLNYLKASIGGYTETNAHAYNLQLQDQHVTSLTSDLGGQISQTMSRSFGVVIPEATLVWHHQFSNDSRQVLARYVADPLAANYLAAPTEAPDRDYFSLGIGVSAVLPRGMQAFVHYETVLGLENISDHLFTGGVRLEF